MKETARGGLARSWVRRDDSVVMPPLREQLEGESSNDSAGKKRPMQERRRRE